MSEKFKILQLNIEADNHLNKVVNLILQEKPDICTFQEVFEADLEYLTKKTGMRYIFGSFTAVNNPNPYRLNPRGNMGVAIFSNHEIYDKNMYFYHQVANS